MNHHESESQLVADAAQILNARRVGAYEGEAAWRVDASEDTAFDIEFDAEENRLIVSSDVCDVPAEGRTRFHELMLVFNGGWRQTGGLRFALDGMGGSAMLMLELSTVGLGAARLSGILANMSDIVAAWRTLLGSAGTTGH